MARGHPVQFEFRPHFTKHVPQHHIHQIPPPTRTHRAPRQFTIKASPIQIAQQPFGQPRPHQVTVLPSKLESEEPGGVPCSTVFPAGTPAYEFVETDGIPTSVIHVFHRFPNRSELSWDTTNDACEIIAFQEPARTLTSHFAPSRVFNLPQHYQVARSRSLEYFRHFPSHQ